MLQLYDLNKIKIKGLRLYKDMNIESVLTTGDKTLSFLYPSRLSKDIKEECYIRTKKDEFVVKEISTNGEWNSIKARLNVDELEGQAWEHFDTTEKTISECLTLAVAGTGWTVQVTGVTKKRTIRKTNCSTWDIIQQAKKTYLVEIEFDTINKIVNVYEKLGADKGVYFMDSLNLRNLDVQSNSYDFFTRIIAIGKDDLKVTVENFQYSSKKKTFIWKDERYTDISSLTEDATKKLDEISKPYKAYGADIIDLANTSSKYSILSYGLGDTITLISKDKGIKEKQRIVKITEYPEEPHRNSCEIANSILSFEDIQKEYNDNVDTVNNITSDNGTISEGAIRTAVEHLTVNKLDVGSLNAVEIRVGTLEATSATITQLKAVDASIVNLQSNKANITDLTASVGRIEILESSVGDIQTLVNGNLTSNNIQSLILTSDKVTVANGFIKNAMIENLDVSKINAGDISVNKFRIKSDSGNLLIFDNTIQIKDSTRVRVQIGKDASNDYNMYVWDSNGNLMFDATGLKADGIKQKIIRDDMVSDNANIQGSKLNISSVVTSINNGTATLKSSKILFDETNQTLNVAFNTLTTKVDGIEVGGRNLFRNSSKEITTTRFTSIPVVDIFKNYIGRDICISFDCKINENGIIRSIMMYPYQNNGISIQNSFTFTPSNSYKRFSFVTAIRDFGINNPSWTPGSIGFYDYSGDNNYTIKNIKIELGNKPTDWTPAPEDVDASIQGVKTITESNTTAISVQQGKIATLISNTTIVKDGQTIQLKDSYNSTVATVDSISSTISSHTTTINDLTGQVTAVDTKTNEVKRTLDGTVATVSSHTTSINGLNITVSTQSSSITQLQNQIALKVESKEVTSIVNGAIDKIEVGGRNLIVRTGEMQNKLIGIDGAITPSAGCAVMSNYISVIPGEIITFTKTESTVTDGGYWRWRWFDINQIYISRKADISNKFQWVVPNGVYFIQASYPMDAYPKLEKGNKATDWTPAPEDVDASIQGVDERVTTTNNKVATIETDLTGITSRVSSVEQTTTTINGNITSLTTRMNTAEQKITDTAIVSTVRSSTYYKNDLGAKVSSNEIISCINQTSEAIKISASKINLTGYVTMTNLSTAGQTIIDGGNIKTNTISLERLKSATNNPIIRLFGKCSLDATAADEVGVGSAVRLKWNAENYIYIATNNMKFYQGGVAKYTITPAGLYLDGADLIINGGFLTIGGKQFRGWGFSSGNKYWLGISNDDKYVRMYNNDVTVANGVTYIGSPSGRYIKVYSTQAADVSSDRRKKTNILAYDEKIETFYDNLKPISYELINGHSGRKHYGFIAQDVEDAMGVAGLDYKDMALLQKAPMDVNGNEIDPTTIVDYSTDERIVDYEYSLAYTEMISINTHMIQKLRQEITQLKNEISEIKGLG